MAKIGILLFFLPFLFISCTSTKETRPRYPELQDIVPYSDNLMEGRYEIHGRISFTKTSEGIGLEVQGNDKNERAYVVWPEWGPDYRKIDTSQVYRVEILARETVPYYHFEDLLRVSSGDRMLIDASRCHVHRCAMKRQIENSVSGGDYGNSYFRLRKRSFPNDGNAYELCGSGIQSNTWRCPKCYSSYERWGK